MMQTEWIRETLIGLGVVALQVILFRHLQIFGAEADLVLIYLLWICTRRNRTSAILFAFCFAFFQDALTDLWGLHTFSKTLVVFLLHNYLSRASEQRFIIWQIFLIILFSAMLHNGSMILLSLFVDLYSTGSVFWSTFVGSSLYTALTGSFIYLVRNE